MDHPGKEAPDKSQRTFNLTKIDIAVLRELQNVGDTTAYTGAVSWDYFFHRPAFKEFTKQEMHRTLIWLHKLELVDLFDDNNRWFPIGITQPVDITSLRLNLTYTGLQVLQADKQRTAKPSNSA